MQLAHMKKKQPYIPLYIGDWEQDVNCLSLEAEGAWLKLTFKLWKGKQRGLLTISFQQMSLLFKKSLEKTREIFNELVENDVFDHEKIDEKTVLIKGRRMLKEAQLSSIRSEIGSKGAQVKKEKRKQNESKRLAKQKQKPDIDIDYDTDNNLEKGSGKTLHEHGHLEIPESFFDVWDKWVDFKRTQFKFSYKTPDSERTAAQELVAMAKGNPEYALKIVNKSITNGWKGLFGLEDKKTTLNGNHKPTINSSAVIQPGKDFGSLGKR